MKITKILILATAVASWLSPLHAQTTEVTVNLLSKLAKSDGDGDRSFNISFGSLVLDPIIFSNDVIESDISVPDALLNPKFIVIAEVAV